MIGTGPHARAWPGPACLVLYVLVVSVMAAWSQLRPDYGWDLLGYMGAALSMEQQDAAAVHAQVYRDAQAALPAEAYRELSAGGDAPGYRREVARHPEYFAQQLPFYAIRPLYTAPMLLLHKAGMNLAHAATTLSTLAYVAIAALIYVWLRRHLGAVSAALLALLLAVSPPLVQAARFTTPDTLSAALLLFAFYALIEQRRTPAFGALMLLAIAARPDNIVLALMTLAWLRLLAPPAFAVGGAAFALLGGAFLLGYGVIQSAAGHYGWATLFYHSFIANLASPAEHAAWISFADYIRVVLDRGFSSIMASYLLLFLFLGAFGGLFARARGEPFANDLHAHLILLLVANIGARFLLFPVVWDRLLVAHYLLIAILLVIQSRRTLPGIAAVPARPGAEAAPLPGAAVAFKEGSG